MLHGPCGEGYEDVLCMKDGKCSKKYPRPFRETTTIDRNGVVFKRPNNQRTILNKNRGTDEEEEEVVDEKKDKKGKSKFAFDNRHVVPYNPYLSSKYECHINIDLVIGDKAVKYLHKYLYKGSDRVTLSVDEKYDEISRYANSMYVCAIEAAWRILSFPMNGRSHSVQMLAVHLKDNQQVQDCQGDKLETIEARGETTLTQYFQTNARDPAARELLYADFPKHYVWTTQNKRKIWKPRKRGGDSKIGRMVSCSPRDRERYFMRLIFCYRKGATSFEDLRTVDGKVYNTYADAAVAAGYAEDDNHCHNCMKEAATFKMPRQLRQLFAMLLAHSSPLDPAKLWGDFLEDMSEDFGDSELASVRLKVLHDIEDSLVSAGMSLTGFPMLPQIAETHDAAMEEAPTAASATMPTTG